MKIFNIVCALLFVSSPTVAQFAQFEASNNGISFNTTVFNCSSGTTPFSATNTSCGVGGLIAGSGAAFKAVGTQSGSTPSVSGGVVTVVQPSTTHAALSLVYQTKVSVLSFQTTFQFVMNGWGGALVFENSNNNPTFNGASFSGGAGCEGGWFQGFAQAAPPNNLFALDFTSYSGNGGGSSTFTYSSVQVYNSGVQATGSTPQPASAYPGQDPCNANLGGTNHTYVGFDRYSTSPVPFNSPVGSVNSPTGDTYQATVTYDGSTLTLNLFDVTASGTCTPTTSTTCFTQVWSNINISSIVGASTAWVLICGTTGSSPTLANPFNVGPIWVFKTP
jgi:hypothetical protein